MNKFFLKFIILFLALCPQIDGHEFDYVADTFFITGKRNIKNTALPFDYKIISNQELKQYNDNIFELFANRHNIMFETDGIFGQRSVGATKFRIRGLNANILIDGLPAVDSMELFNCSISNAIDRKDIDSIEFYNSGASALFGSGALGGAVNLLTKPPQKKNGSLAINYGSFNSFKSDVYYSDFIDNSIYYSYNFGYKKTDGHIVNTALENFNGALKIGYVFNKNKLEIQSAVFDEDNEDPIEEVRWKKDRKNFNFKFDGGVDKFFYSLKAYNISGKHTSHKLLDNSWNFSSTDFNRGFNINAGAEIIEFIVFSAGFDYKNFGGEIPAKNWANAGEFENYERAPYLSLNFDNNDYGFNYAIRLNGNSLYDKIYLNAYSVYYKFSEHYKIILSAAKSFRTPPVFHTLINKFKANPALLPEQMWTYNSAIQYNSDNHLFEFALFKNQGKNRLITSTPKFSNSGSFEHNGFELSYSAYLNNHLKFSTAYQYLYSAADSKMQYRNKINGNLSYKKNKSEYFMNGYYVNKLFGSDFKQNRLPDFINIDAYYKRRLKENIYYELAVLNILNDKYSLNYDEQYGKAAIKMPGIMINTGISLFL